MIGNDNAKEGFMDDTQNILTVMEEYERLYSEAQPLVERLEELKSAIKNLVLEEGESISHGNVRATYRQPYTRAYWDSSGLEGYAVADPKLLSFREERQYGPSVSVSVRN